MLSYAGRDFRTFPIASRGLQDKLPLFCCCPAWHRVLLSLYLYSRYNLRSSVPVKGLSVFTFIAVYKIYRGHDIVPATSIGSTATHIESRGHTEILSYTPYVLNGENHFTAFITTRFEQACIIRVEFFSPYLPSLFVTTASKHSLAASYSLA
mgnify:CR=1 FL=1